MSNETEGRVVHDGKLKSMRPITESFESPNEGDLENLKQFCKVAYYLSGFHSMVHLDQAKWATDLDIASLAPENHQKKLHQPQGGTGVAAAVRQLAVANILVDYKGPKLIDDLSAHPKFIDMLKSQEKTFLRLGYNVREWYPGVPI